MNLDSIRKRVEAYQDDGKVGMVVPLEVLMEMLHLIDEHQKALTPSPAPEMAIHQFAVAIAPDVPSKTTISPAPGVQIDKSVLREKLAYQIHASWTRWMKYIFNNGQLLNTGQFAIDADKVKRWTRQMETPYADLSNGEQASDRANANRYLELME